MENTFNFNWAFDDWSIDALISDLDVFSSIDFSVLYSWLPSDIASSIQLCLGALAVLAVMGILRRIWDSLPIL